MHPDRGIKRLTQVLAVATPPALAGAIAVITTNVIQSLSQLLTIAPLLFKRRLLFRSELFQNTGMGGFTDFVEYHAASFSFFITQLLGFFKNKRHFCGLCLVESKTFGQAFSRAAGVASLVITLPVFSAWT
jgi:hypothetical protein